MNPIAPTAEEGLTRASDPGERAPDRERSAPPAPDELDGSLEAVLLSMDRPISPGRLAAGLGSGVTAGDVERSVGRLNDRYAATGRSFRIEPVAGGYRLMTLPQFAQAVGAFARSRANARLSRAAIETLAIIAYRQPITRAALEGIRGVACGEVLRSLLERRLVNIAGRAEELGRPILYGTGREFLEAFGIASLRDLPTVSELKL